MERQCDVTIRKLVNGFLVTLPPGPYPYTKEASCYQNLSELGDWLYRHFVDERIPEEDEAGWIDIKERLPEMGQKVLVITKAAASIPTVLEYEGGGFMWHYFWTHWKPAPDPPSCDCSDCAEGIHHVECKNL